MRLEHFGLKGVRRKALVVLGAGASRGAEFVQRMTGALPPLDADFFQQLSRLRESKPSAQLLEFVRSEYGHGAGLSMEQFFSEADYTKRFHAELKVDPGPQVKRYEKTLDDFYEALADLLSETTARRCQYHELLAGALHADDTVLTYNYDCIMDRALEIAGGHRWDPAKGSYGFDVTAGAAAWCRLEKGRKPAKPIQLLKMHGSVNWIVTEEGADGTSVSLRPDGDDISTLKGSIIPPTWFKDLTRFPFADVWKRARIAVRRARIIVVVGYSVPQTDLFSRSLFKVEAGSKEKREKLDLLVLVNPDANSRHEFIDLVSGGIEPRTRVLEYEKLEDLHALMERNTDEISHRRLRAASKKK